VVKSDTALLFLETLARAAGEVIRPYFQSPELAVDLKSDATPVTQADRRSEEVMRELIAKHFPGHGIMGEEFGRENEGAEYVWILDPIDGTKSFVAGVPLFGVLIGLLYQGRPIAGCIYQPILEEMCLGDGTRTTLNGREVRVRPCPALRGATVLGTCLKTVEDYQSMASFEQVRRAAGLFRTWGDCYGYLMVATGRADLMMDPVLNPWDLLPLIPIMEGAGGVITSWEGGDPIAAGNAVAGSPLVHAEALRLLKGTS
jgi:myo-inositol-1(or 4)-monophosphatase